MNAARNTPEGDDLEASAIKADRDAHWRATHAHDVVSTVVTSVANDPNVHVAFRSAMSNLLIRRAAVAAPRRFAVEPVALTGFGELQS